MERKEILEAAAKCVCGDREQDYGTPEANFERIAKLWEVYLHDKVIPFGKGIEINPEDVAVMMALLKIARIASRNYHADNYVDACGYMACAGECAGR